MNSYKLIFALLAFAITGTITSVVLKGSFEEALIGALVSGITAFVVSTVVENS
jgi:VIT1/CCC1 family predicted Fe2+/Mn2+ transporter